MDPPWQDKSDIFSIIGGGLCKLCLLNSLIFSILDLPVLVYLFVFIFSLLFTLSFPPSFSFSLPPSLTRLFPLSLHSLLPISLFFSITIVY